LSEAILAKQLLYILFARFQKVEVAQIRIHFVVGVLKLTQYVTIFESHHSVVDYIRTHTMHVIEKNKDNQRDQQIDRNDNDKRSSTVVSVFFGSAF
jgi:hypothetical protein